MDPQTTRLYPPILAWLIAGSLPMAACQAQAANEVVEYDSTFLMGSSASTIDLSRYTEGNPTLAGRYNVSIHINDKPVMQQDIDFIDIADKRSAQACITAKMLIQWHVRTPENSDPEAVLASRENTQEACLDVEKLIPQANVRYDNSEQRLYLTVPQAWLVHSWQNTVDPSLWEDGINAAMFSYNLSGWHSETYDRDSDSFYAGLYAGLNLGSWHFRSRGNYSWNHQGESEFAFQSRYLQRDIAPLRSQLIVGDAYTTGESFDSVSIRGMRLYSDSRMLPAQLANFSPVVRGVANSNARITIMQGGYKIYETTVPPGPFAIDDLSPSGYGSDLEVTIEESDGTKRTFSQPFSSVIQMMHPGVGRWDVSLGEVNKDDLRDKPGIAQGTFYYGLNNTLTGYTGVQATDNGYLAALLGIGVNTWLGAFAFDITQSQAEIPDDATYRGQSYRLSWNKFFEPTSTSLNIAAYRYSTEKYLGLNDALTLIDDARHPNREEDSRNLKNYGRMKNQFSLSLNQSLQQGEENYGSLYFTGSWTDYWVTGSAQRSYSLGYSNGASWGSYSINLQRTYDENNRQDDRIYLSVSIPLEKLFGTERYQGGFRNLNSSMSADYHGNNQLSVNSSGSSENNRLNYSVNTSYSTSDTAKDLSSVGGFMGYESPWGSLTGSASVSNDNTRQISLNTDGGFVLHRHGVTFSNDSFGEDDTLSLVSAPGAKGARINYANSTIDRWGYGATGSLSPYSENTISLDINDLENDIELKSTSTIAIPRQGAVILSHFDTDTGRPAMISLARSDNLPVPFATDIFNDDGEIVGSVGQGGQAFIRGIEEKGTLWLRWVEKSQLMRCRFDYQLPAEPTLLGKTVVMDATTCQMQKG